MQLEFFFAAEPKFSEGSVKMTNRTGRAEKLVWFSRKIALKDFEAVRMNGKIALVMALNLGKKAIEDDGDSLDFYEMPKSWIYKIQKDTKKADEDPFTTELKEENWRTNIRIAANENFNKFGFLNQYKETRTFLSYKKGEPKELCRLIGSTQNKLVIARNSQTKDHIFCIQNSFGKGKNGVKTALTTAICYYDKETYKSI